MDLHEAEIFPVLHVVNINNQDVHAEHREVPPRSVLPAQMGALQLR